MINNILDEDSIGPQEVEVNVATASKNSVILTKWLTLFFLHLQAVFRIADGAIACILCFLKSFLNVLGEFSSVVAEIAKLFPSSMYKARKMYTKELRFRRNVVCRKCHRLYFLRDCIEGIGATQRSKRCPFQRFPFHPHQRMRADCVCLLVKTVELASGKKFFCPFLSYCYMSLETSVQCLLNRPGIFARCEEWHARQVESGTYRDVYDGQVWSEFQNYDGKPFLSEPNNLVLIMNFDFSQPYKHVNYSVGALYCVIMNLPRGICYKQENVILTGLIPGPQEPEHDINTFLEPFVDELLKFWDGIYLNVHSFTERKLVHCALLCIACDIPAGRKMCGFMGHCAHYGCSRCHKWFRGGFGELDYSGFEKENWDPRTGSAHRQFAMRLCSFRTQADRDRRESESGCCSSVLLKLQYFDAPRMLIVDPMHNLFLGTAKHYLKNIWLKSEIISDAHFETNQKRVDSTMVPFGIGRIPHKIRSGFSSFTADQWKH